MLTIEGNERILTWIATRKEAQVLTDMLQVLIMMAAIVRKFFVASIFMWVLPLAVLYGFHHNLFPGFTEMSYESQTLLSGLVAVISVNVVIAYYIYIALKEPSVKHSPDPAFVARAKASVNVSQPEGSTESHGKRD